MESFKNKIEFFFEYGKIWNNIEGAPYKKWWVIFKKLPYLFSFSHLCNVWPEI